MFDFEQALQDRVHPLLKQWGYEYEVSLGSGDWIFGFRKLMHDQIENEIVFQRSADDDDKPTGYRFLIKMHRVRLVDTPNRYDRDYEGSLGYRLGELLWFFYGLRTYSSYNHWWPETENGMSEALDKLERYALPWLDDMQEQFTSWVDKPQWQLFEQTFLDILPPVLTEMDYEIRFDPDRKLIPYGAKVLNNDLTSFVIFNPLRLLHTYGFDILLFRKRSQDPFDDNWQTDNICFEAWARKLLPSILNVSISAQPPGIWRYTNQTELRDQLIQAANVLKTYAVPFLEDLNTTQSNISNLSG